MLSMTRYEAKGSALLATATSSISVAVLDGISALGTWKSAALVDTDIDG